MKVITFHLNKLVRDKMADSMRSKDCIVYDRVLSNQDEFISALKAKLVEEALEVKESKKIQDLIEEVADLFEVVEALLKVSDISLDQIKDAQTLKQIKKGSFSARIFVDCIETKEDSAQAAYCRAQPEKYPELTK